MRLIGHLPSEQSAATFSSFLFVQGIGNQVEADPDGWAVWIHSEDERERARELLLGFLGNPTDPKFRKSARQAVKLKEQAAQEAEAAEKRVLTRRQVFRRWMPYGAGPLTFSLIVVCLGLAVVTQLGEDKNTLQWLSISRVHRGLPEVASGEVWRLLTPIFLHFGLLHLLFNMMWLFDLGSMIEGRQSSWHLAMLVGVIGVFSNLGQYWMGGPNFGGMSGVVYGLLGYIWMKGRFDPASGLYLHPQTVVMMLIWFFLCFTDLLGIKIANTAHTVGLVMGVAWGFLASLPLGRRG